MLSRLSTVLPSATVSAARSAAPALQRAPLCMRFNSSEVAAAASPENADLDVTTPPLETEAQPKKRGIPLAQNLGDITIRARNPNQRGTGAPKSWALNPQSQTQRQNRPPRDSMQTRDRPPRRDANRQRRVEGDRAAQPAQARGEGGQEAQPAQAQAEGDKVRPKEGRTAREVWGDPVVIPTAAQVKVELGDLDQLFGPLASQAATATTVEASSSTVSPSQARVQLLLERTAGDYSRYVPRPYPSTDVTKLGPVGLSGFVLSRRRDVKLSSRDSALMVVKKFAGGKGAQVSA
ncbi:hypothetical protein C8Q80DRAFT_1264416 [Daedaleopsis nitida]|nr:hypothetical protein C8Q80DRAFT_1264416 [Daedaleopsis nitida]